MISDPSPPMILLQLRNCLLDERKDNDLQPIDPGTLTRARDRLRKIENSIKAREYGETGDASMLVDEHEAIEETIEDLQNRRFEKVIMLARYPVTAVPVEKMQPQEVKLYQGMREAIMVYWGAGK